jgi:hypothetical protein
MLDGKLSCRRHKCRNNYVNGCSNFLTTVKAIPSLTVNTEDFKIGVKRKLYLSHLTLLSRKKM